MQNHFVFQASIMRHCTVITWLRYFTITKAKLASSLSPALFGLRFFPDQDCWPRTPQWGWCISTYLFKIKKTIVTVQFRSQHSTGTAQTELRKNWQNCLSFLHESTLDRKVSDSFGNEKSIPSHYCFVFLGHLGWILNEICFYDNSSFLDLISCRKLQ